MKTAVKKTSQKPALKKGARKSLIKDPDAIILKPAHLQTLASVIREFDQNRINVHTVAVSPGKLYIETEEKNGKGTGIHKIIMS